MGNFKNYCNYLAISLLLMMLTTFYSNEIVSEPVSASYSILSNDLSHGFENHPIDLV